MAKAKLIFTPTEVKPLKMKAYIFQSDHYRGQWYWHIRRPNGKVIANGEGYHNKADAIKTLKLFNIPIYETS